MVRFDVIIVGAGISGLYCMKLLSEKGYNCCLLEANAVPGGRIRTIIENGFEGPVEGGAEFIHGKLPRTLKLVKEAGLKTWRLKVR